jgi:membrane-associated HD superfamily phosphohydrolase
MADSVLDAGRTEAGRPRAKVILIDAVAHALPLIIFYRANGSVQSYLLLTAFDLALGLMLIVGTTRDAKDPTTVDPRAALLISRITAALVLAVFLGGVAAILTIPLGMPAFISGMVAHVDWVALVTRPGFYLTVAFMMLSAGVRAQLRFEAATRVGERGTSLHAGPVVGDLARDQRSARVAYSAQVTLIGVYLLLCFLLIHFGRNGLYIFPALYAALLVFFDARPDIGQRIFPDLWPKSGEQSKRPKHGRRR